MKLYAIEFRHYSQKDSREGIATYVLADDETTIRDRIDLKYRCGGWKDKDQDGPVNIYDDDYEIIGQETYLARMLRMRGDLNDPDHEVTDLYYGATEWGWSDGQEISEALAADLVRLGIAKDWRLPASTGVRDPSTIEAKGGTDGQQEGENA